MKFPAPVIRDDTIYDCYDRFACSHCAGMSVTYQGVTLGGYRVRPLTAADVRDEPATCECAHLRASLDADGRLVTTEVTPVLQPGRLYRLGDGTIGCTRCTDSRVVNTGGEWGRPVTEVTAGDETVSCRCGHTTLNGKE